MATTPPSTSTHGSSKRPRSDTPPSQPSEDGTTSRRRSVRTRVKPVEFWRNERIVYSLVEDETSGEHVPAMGAVITKTNRAPPSSQSGPSSSPLSFVPLAPSVWSRAQGDSNIEASSADESHIHTHRRPQCQPQKLPDLPDISPLRDSLKSSRTAGPPQGVNLEANNKTVININISDDTPTVLSSFSSLSSDDEEYSGFLADVEDYPTGERRTRKIAMSSAGAHYTTVHNAKSNFQYAKTFVEERSFLAAGLIRIPVRGLKSARPTWHNSLLFFVVDGTVEVVINDSVKFRSNRGGQFLVPRGNTYSLANVGIGVTMLHFVQATDTLYNATKASRALQKEYKEHCKHPQRAL
ncbi:Mif2/CENP-C like-domain-containing protein [Limtongia smithiae]|uniref:Mif2/CENP-C like-domain-containing protein n=1 Tax=Limtongia smithiae TaxID=1125753 RepID=UPI0034CDDCB1